MRVRPASVVSRYLVALGATAASVLFRWAADPWLGDNVPFITLFAAVAVAVWWGGVRPAIVATLLGYTACAILFIPPRGTVELRHPDQLLGLALFLLTCAIIIGFGEATQAARRRAMRGQEALLESERRLALELTAVRRMQQVSTRLVQATGFSELLDEILGASIEITGADMGTIQLVENGALRIVAQRGFEAPFLEQFDVTWLGQPAAGAAMQAGQRIVVEDLATSPFFAGTLSLAILQGAGVRALQSTPLVSRAGRLVGLLTTHYRAPRRSEERELQHLDVLARQAGDLIERAEAERSLAAKDAELRRVTDLTPLILTRCGPDLKYRFVNRSAAALFGLSPEQMVGRSIPEVMGPQAFELIRPHVERVLRGEPVEYEAQIRYPRAGLRWVRVNYQPERDATGAVSGWVASISDITERKEWERSLEQADRRKDEFLAMLAHELRNPLAPIRNSARVLLAQAPQDPEVRWCAEVIERQAGHMGRLLEDLLDVTRITHGRLELRRARVGLAAVIRTALETSRPAIERGRHELAVSLPDEDMLLEADPVRLAQVFSNLLNNAANYTEAGGHLRVSCERRGDEAVVSVSDDGIGIEAEVLPRIFDMFSPPVPATAHSHGGLGIGLALARMLVELHAGRIEARSVGRGRGSEFVVTLPVARGTAPPANESANESADGAVGRPLAGLVRRVLVADDVKDSADTLAMLVRSMGHEVRTAYDGQEAVDAAESFVPHLVLLDLGMPRLDGYEACRLLRARSAGRSMVLVALTGWDQEHHRRRSQDAGFDRHLVKPVDLSVLAELLADVRPADIRPAG